LSRPRVEAAADEINRRLASDLVIVGHEHMFADRSDTVAEAEP
jgi:hypothetical protein